MTGWPVLFGYQRVHLGTSEADVHAGRRALTSFALREGFVVAEVFVEADANRPCRSLASLIRVVRRHHMATVAVPGHADLGGSPAVQAATADRIRRESGARVLVVEEYSSATPRRARPGLAASVSGDLR